MRTRGLPPAGPEKVLHHYKVMEWRKSEKPLEQEQLQCNNIIHMDLPSAPSITVSPSTKISLCKLK